MAPLEQDSAVRLFVQRATAVRPNFTVTGENSAAIREICSRLDGLPLAIELAAARTKLLSPNAILHRLQSRLQLLTGGALDLPERQQTLRNTIDWSHGLLNESEQKLFRRFAVFIGGCTLEAAEAICNTGRDLGIDLFDGVSSLVDKNLLQRADPLDRKCVLRCWKPFANTPSNGWYRAAKKPQRGARTQLSAWCSQRKAIRNSARRKRDRWLARCDVEIDNFRSALDWLVVNRELDWGLRLCMALFRFWDMRGRLIEGRARLEVILRLAGSGYANERAKVGIFLGALSTAQ